MSLFCWCCVLPGLRLSPWQAGKQPQVQEGLILHVCGGGGGALGTWEGHPHPHHVPSLLGVPGVVAPSRHPHSAVSIQSSSLCLHFLYGLTSFYEVPFPHELAREIYLSSKTKQH